MAAQDFQIIHVIPGRIRVKIGKVKDNPALADDLQRKLSAIRVIQQAVVNPVTGSVLLTYDPRLLESLNSLEFGDASLLESVHDLLRLATPLGISLGDVDTETLEAWFRAHSNGSTPTSSSTVAGSVTAFFGMLDAKVAQASSGWSDLKALIPLTLFFLGVRSLLVVEKVPLPAWYDYFWFAFGTFIALHPHTSSRN